MIALENVSVHWKKRRREVIKALDEVTFGISQGEFFALLGENGAGKSTAMHLMLGLIRPTKGRVLLFGAPPLLGSDTYQDIGYLPEEPHHYPPYLTINEALDYYERLYRRTMPRQRRFELLERLGLTEFQTLRIGKCSKGMKQKVGIVQALIGEPKLLFLDEPMRGLDPVGVRTFRDILVEMNRNGCTIVMNSHILAEVESVATTAAILKRGRLIACGSISSLTRPGERYDVAFAGEAPEYVTVTECVNGTSRGTLSPEHVADFLRLATDGSIRIESLAHSHATLEQTFLSLVREEGANA